MSTPCLDTLEAAEGIYIQDATGKKYMDFHGNNVHQLGYGHPHVMKRVQEQIAKLPFSPRRFTNETAIECAEKLTQICGGELNRVLFAPGGTSAVGMALKLARHITGNYKVVVPYGGISQSAAFTWDIIPLGIAIAVLSSALPYTLEMITLRNMSPQGFSIMMSLEPAIAALAGLVILGELLSIWQWLAILLVIIASVGSSTSNSKKQPTPA